MKSEKNGSEVAIKTSPLTLIEMAIEKGASIENLEKLMALQERWESNQAKKTFLIAMSEFQSRCPVMQKGKTVNFKNSTGSITTYKYATLGSITETISSLLKDCGLSYRWETKEGEKGITITCTVSHIDGHSETNSMTAAMDDSGRKNKIQQQGSTMSYLQRYTLIGALGISTADGDNDGQRAAAPKPKKENSAKLMEEAKQEVGKFEDAEKMNKEAMPLLQGYRARGLNDKHKAELTDLITRKYQSLILEENEAV